MEKLNIFKKVISFVACSALSVAAVGAYPALKGSRNNASAKTIAEIQEERKANTAKIEELQSQINSLEGDKENEQAYQSTLYEQIGYIQDNIDLLNKELDSINSDIETAQDNISDLDQAIVDQQEEIDENVELFKKRLCAMYVTGNDNLATVMVGTSSFYDMLSRVEMVNRIASYDEELITDILTEIDNMEQSKKDLETEKLTLEMRLEDQKKRKEEKDAEMASLNDKMSQTQDEINRIAMEQQTLELDKAELQDYIAQLDAEEAAIEAEIARQAAAAQAAYEAEQARLAQERAAAAAAAAQQAAQQGDTSYTPVVTSEPAYIPCSRIQLHLQRLRIQMGHHPQRYRRGRCRYHGRSCLCCKVRYSYRR